MVKGIWAHSNSKGLDVTPYNIPTGSHVSQAVVSAVSKYNRKFMGKSPATALRILLVCGT
ncbi:MAG: hypothetical protein AAF959_14455 [Cyanobacteria bacterium P01_D01_bin.56]